MTEDTRIAQRMHTGGRTVLFRGLMADALGWPGGEPPASIVAHPGPWYRVAVTPDRTARGAVSRAWCRWLVERGWALPHEPGPDSGVWLAVPGEWARALQQLGRELGCAAAAVIPWQSVAGEDHPEGEFLRARYPQA